MKTFFKPSDLLAMEPRLLVDLKKAASERLIVSLEKSAEGGKGKGGWSDAARAAAQAARKAKAEGAGDPKQAAAVAKAMVEKGASVEDAVKEGVKVAGKNQQRTLKLTGGGDGKGEPNSFKEAGIEPQSTIDTLDKIPKDFDPISTPHSVSTIKGNKITIDTDDGNESSYGRDQWELDKGKVTLLFADGRDGFEGNVSDKLQTKIGQSIPVEKFRSAYATHMRTWAERTKTGVADAGNDDD